MDEWMDRERETGILKVRSNRWTAGKTEGRGGR